MSVIKGIKIVENYISEEEERKLSQIIDEQIWDSSLKRRVQHYGYRYNYRDKNLAFKIPVPDWLDYYCNKLYRDKILNHKPNQIIINEYMPGQGISPHIDRTDLFNDEVCSLSLSADIIMNFDKGEFKLSNLIKRRSLCVLKGESRYNWRHGIASRKTDIVDGIKYSRGRRISLTFRKTTSSNSSQDL